MNELASSSCGQSPLAPVLPCDAMSGVSEKIVPADRLLNFDVLSQVVTTHVRGVDISLLIGRNS